MFQAIQARLAVLTAAVLLVLLGYTVAANGADAATAEIEQDPATSVLDDAEVAHDLLNEFWTQELARLYGLNFDTPDRFVSYQGSNNPPCAGKYRNFTDNAYYCWKDGDEYVAFDLDWFTSYLERFPGDATTFLILAHEWGHAVQDTWQEQQPNEDTWSPEYNVELQADCLAGVFLDDALTRGSLLKEEGDAEAIFTQLYEVGSGPWFAPGDHGTSEQRMLAFSHGFLQGTDYCRVGYSA